MSKNAIIILAAGSSSRLGYPKQLLKHYDQSFIRHAVAEASKVSDRIIVVLGANEEAMKEELIGVPAKIVQNKNWEEGMSSSIRCGLTAVLHEEPNTQSVILMVCDQPYVNSGLLEQIIAEQKRSTKPIVACVYSGTIGTPSLFDKSFFSALLNLKGQTGAKSILAKHSDLMAAVSFPEGDLDIDTQEDYDQFLKNEKLKS
jgi:molybdenum cofactor cytidylyltransferase